jgi:hypothetical protein
LAAIVVSRFPPPDAAVANRHCAYRATASVVEKPAGSPFAVTCFDSDPSQAARAANALAERYARGRLADCRRQADALCAVARARTEKARHDEDQATVRWLEATQQAAEQKRADNERFRNSRPAMVENPQWSSLQRQLAELVRRREELLIGLTPLHPTVLDIDARIESVKTELDATPQKIADPAPNGTDGAGTADARIVSQAGAERHGSKLAELSAALESAHRARWQAESAQQQAALGDAGPQLAIEPARAVPIASETADCLPPPVAWTTLAAGLTMAAGVGLIWLGRSAEPPVANLREIQLDLGETSIHTVETDDPPRDFAGLRRRELTRRAAIVAGWCLLAAFSLPAIQQGVGIALIPNP